jgi:hypothetical protein
MGAIMRNPAWLTRILSIIAILLMTSTPGCALSGVDNSAFIWNTDDAYPPTRENVPGEWYSALDKEEVIEQALSTGKPIFCYLSQYEEYGTDEAEQLVLSRDGWGDVIVDEFIPWEVNFWEDPALNLQLARGAGPRTTGWVLSAPAFLILRPQEEEGARGEFLVVDGWSWPDGVYFPGHPGPNATTIDTDELVFTPGSREGRELIEDLKTEAGMQFGIERNYVMGIISPYQELVDSVDMAVDFLDEFGDPSPELCLYLKLVELETGEENDDIQRAIGTWEESYMPGYEDEPLLGNIAFLDSSSPFSSGFECVSPARNLLVLQSYAVFGGKYEVPPEDVLAWFYGLVVDDSGEYAGGIPPYLDRMRSMDDLSDLNITPYDVLFGDITEDLLSMEGAPGRRDIPWVNAQAISLWLELVTTEPDLREMEMPDGRTAGAFALDLALTVLGDLEMKTGLDNPESMRLMDSIYMLDLLLQLFEITGDRGYLDKAGSIAATFPFDRREEWFEPNNGVLMSDLIIGLHRYSVLAEDQGAADTADFLEEYAPAFVGMMYGTIDEVNLLNSIDVKNAHVINVAVIGSQGNLEAMELMQAAHEGWDPRRMVQLLDPERDADLIEEKHIEASTGVSAYVLADGSFEGTASTPDELRRLIEEVTSNYQSDRKN